MNRTECLSTSFVLWCGITIFETTMSACDIFYLRIATRFRSGQFVAASAGCNGMSMSVLILGFLEADATAPDVLPAEPWRVFAPAARVSDNV